MEGNTNSVTQQILRTPFSEDIPRAFSLDEKQHRNYTGPYIETILNFAFYQKLNLELDVQENHKNDEISYKIQKGFYNISLLGGLYSTDTDFIQYSYPIEEIRNCIVVPLEDELPKYYYVVWPFGRWIWLLMVLGVFYMAYLMRMLARSPKASTSSFQLNVLYSIALILYTSNMNVPSLNTSTRSMLFYTMLFLLGFILSNFHICYMTTYCMKPVFVRPINNIDELAQARIPVLVPDNIISELHNSDIYIGSSLPSLVRVVNRTNFQRLLKNRDRSFAYVLAQDQWNYLNRQQSQLIQPYFHLSHICFNKSHQAFPMQVQANLNRAFNIFLFRVTESGLWRQWEEEAFRMAVHAGYADMLLDTYPVEPLNLEFFKFAWLVLAVGAPLSCSAMLLELFMWRKYARYENSRAHILAFRRNFEHTPQIV